MAREGQGYPCVPHDIMMIYINIYIYIMKIIPTWPRASQPRFHQTALQDCIGEVDKDEIHFIS